jgi:hypothetical protein
VIGSSGQTLAGDGFSQTSKDLVFVDQDNTLNFGGATTGFCVGDTEPGVKWKFCPTEGKALEPEWRFCPLCGKGIGVLTPVWWGTLGGNGAPYNATAPQIWTMWPKATTYEFPLQAT